MNSSQLVEYTDGDTVAISNLGHISILSVHNVTRELQGVWVVSVEVGDGVRLTEELFLVVTRELLSFQFIPILAQLWIVSSYSIYRIE